MYASLLLDNFPIAFLNAKILPWKSESTCLYFASYVLFNFSTNLEILFQMNIDAMSSEFMFKNLETMVD